MKSRRKGTPEKVFAITIESKPELTEVEGTKNIKSSFSHRTKTKLQSKGKWCKMNLIILTKAYDGEN